jgi:nitroreductase
LLIAATNQGIASCWVAGDKKPYCSQISNLFDVPDSLRLVSLVALGYPASDHAFKTIDKRNLKEIMHWGKF